MRVSECRSFVVRYRFIWTRGQNILAIKENDDRTSVEIEDYEVKVDLARNFYLNLIGLIFNHNKEP
jgi:hypothetical protein